MTSVVVVSVLAVAVFAAFRCRRGRVAQWVGQHGRVLLSAVTVLLVTATAASAVAFSPGEGRSPHRPAHGADMVLLDDEDPQFPPPWWGSGPPPQEPAEPQEPATPPSGNVGSEALRAAEQSTVKVIASAGVEVHSGSGFVVGNGWVMTNAHVIEGANTVTVQLSGVGDQYPATITRSDPAVDVAVLNVPDLRAPVLDFAGDAPNGAPAVVAGYPGGGNLDVREATIADRSQDYGQDAGGGFVSRDVYTIRGLVRPGNSGCPLLTPEGQVYGMVFARSVNDPETGFVLTSDQIRDYAS